MPLVKPTLEKALEAAFSQAMYEFINSVRNNQGEDVSATAIANASSKFSKLAATAVDAYIKSATVIVPPGQVVSSVSAAGPVAGATTLPSPPAIIT